MTRRATVRLVTAATATAAGTLLAVIAGKPEALLLIAPWGVLLLLGLARSQNGEVEAEVAIEDDRLMVGDQVELVANISGMAGTVKVTALPGATFWTDPTSEAPRPEASVFDIVVGDKAQVSLPLSADQWGTHEIGRIGMTIIEPYGLFEWSGEAGEPSFVRVHPTQTEVQNLLAPWLVRRMSGAHNSSAVGRGIEYADIRPFTSGDSLRDINWKATARSNDVWVSQRHPERATDVVLLLDSFVESGHDVRMVFGLAVEAAMALAESHLTVTDRVGLVELGGTLRWVRPATGRHQLQQLADTLLSTGFHGNVSDRDLTVLMTRALPPRSFVIALSPLLDERFIGALTVVAAHGHDVAVVECEAVADTSDDATTALVNRIWQAERQKVRDQLAESGIAVASWKRGDHLDITLTELTGRRRRALRGSRR